LDFSEFRQKAQNSLKVSADLKKLALFPCPKLEGNFKNLLEAIINYKKILPDPPLITGLRP